MNILGCKCLNIIIETELNKSTIVVEKDQLDLSNDENEDHFFQNENLRLVEKLDNIHKSVPGLIETREVGFWIVHYCINCKVHTHAVHKEKGASCVLVNANLLTSDAIEKIRKSDNFSKIYGVLINTSHFCDEKENIFYPNELESTVKSIKLTVADNMRKEAATVEERIKRFTDEQYAYLDNLREKSFIEEQTLLRTLITHVMAKSKKEEGNQDEFDENPNQYSPKFKGSPEENPSQFNTTTSNQARFTPKRQKSTPVQSNYDDSEFLFDLDGIDDEKPSQKNEDVDSDIEESSKNINDRYHSRPRSSSVKIAKSLPMDIPVFMRVKKDDDLDLDDDQDFEVEESVDIAASIKKLAKSVHGGGIFGDLPRPRFSTQL